MPLKANFDFIKLFFYSPAENIRGVDKTNRKISLTELNRNGKFGPVWYWFLKTENFICKHHIIYVS